MTEDKFDDIKRDSSDLLRGIKKKAEDTIKDLKNKIKSSKWFYSTLGNKFYLPRVFFVKFLI